MQIIDADGHVNDRPCMDEISKIHAAGQSQLRSFRRSIIFIFTIWKAATSVRARATSGR